MNTQPKALRLADHLERFRSFPDDLEAAAELRRLSAENAALRQEWRDRWMSDLKEQLDTVIAVYDKDKQSKDALLRQALEALEDVDQIDTQEAVVIDVGDIITAIRQHFEETK